MAHHTYYNLTLSAAACGILTFCPLSVRNCVGLMRTLGAVHKLSFGNGASKYLADNIISPLHLHMSAASKREAERVTCESIRQLTIIKVMDRKHRFVFA